MNGVELLKPGQPVRAKLNELAETVAEEFAVDSVDTRAERRYLIDLQADVTEAMFEALADKLSDIPEFADWCRGQDIAQGAELDRERSW